MFRETRTERVVRHAYDAHERCRREALSRAIAALKRAHVDKAASIVRAMLEGGPNRPLRGDERGALLHAIEVLLTAPNEENAIRILRGKLDAEEPPKRNPGTAQ